MNSINHNSDLSNFSNYLKKDPLNSLNFNDFHYDNPNSPSLSFPYFNNFSQNSNPLEKVDLQAKNDDQIEPKQHTIGFNQLQGFLENSIPYPFDEFKNAKIRKPHTYHFAQGYLNALTEPIDISREQQDKKTQNNKSLKLKRKQKQILTKSGNINSHYQSQPEILTLDDLVLNTTGKSNENLPKPHLHDEPHESTEINLQNLKSIAKIAFQKIKSQKTSSYQTIAINLLMEIEKQTAAYEESHSNRHQKASVSSQSKSSKKSEIIENMIKNKSFAQIKQMNEIQEESEDTKTKKRYPKYQHQDIQEDEEPKQSRKNIKNIRRRLYDAINVMLAANVIEKRERGNLSIKSLENSQKKPIARLREENQSVEELQARIEQKKRMLAGKKKYRQYLAARSLLLEKHMAKNKSVQGKNTKKDQKLTFPLVFVNLELPMRISIGSSAKSVDIETQSQLDINCELDILSFLYWVEKQELIRKQEEIENRVERIKNEDNEICEKIKGHKKIKLQE